MNKEALKELQKTAKPIWEKSYRYTRNKELWNEMRDYLRTTHNEMRARDITNEIFEMIDRYGWKKK